MTAAPARRPAPEARPVNHLICFRCDRPFTAPRLVKLCGVCAHDAGVGQNDWAEGGI